MRTVKSSKNVKMGKQLDPHVLSRFEAALGDLRYAPENGYKWIIRGL